MKCYLHNERDVVATCSNCQRGLCSDCAEKFSIPQCPDCFESIYRQKKKEAKIDLLFCILLLGFPWGWKVVRKILSFLGFILILPIGGFIVYYLIILVTALALGIIAIPIRIPLLISRMKKYEKFINTSISVKSQLLQS